VHVTWMRPAGYVLSAGTVPPAAAHSRCWMHPTGHVLSVGAVLALVPKIITFMRSSSHSRWIQVGIHTIQ
jgi:hypothetical protein